MASTLIDITGKKFGLWTVGNRIGEGSPPRWDCVCECGTRKSVRGSTLREGESTNCGCVNAARFRRLKFIGDANPNRQKCREETGVDLLPVRHPWVTGAQGIQRRCRVEGIAFGFGSVPECAVYLKEIAPTHCPVFGTLLTHGKGSFCPTSPSADRIRPTEGYIRGNIQIISMKANAMKHNATPEELRAFAHWVLG